MDGLCRDSRFKCFGIGPGSRRRLLQTASVLLCLAAFAHGSGKGASRGVSLSPPPATSRMQPEHWRRDARPRAHLLQSRWCGKHSGLVAVANRSLRTQADLLAESLSVGGTQNLQGRFEAAIAVAPGATVVVRVTDGNDREIDNGKTGPDRQQTIPGVVDSRNRDRCCVSTSCRSKTR
jgi:hypothetical protein